MRIAQNLQETLSNISSFQQEAIFNIISEDILKYIDGHEVWNDEKRCNIFNYVYTYIINCFLNNPQEAFSFSREQWGNKISWALEEDNLRGYSEIQSIIDSKYDPDIEIEEDPRKLIKEILEAQRAQKEAQDNENRLKKLTEKPVVNQQEEECQIEENHNPDEEDFIVKKIEELLDEAEKNSIIVIAQEEVDV